MFDSLRVQPALREQQGFKIRYAWYFITANVGIAIVYGYGVLGILFAKVPQEFQWILGLLTPFAKDISSKLLFKVACKSNSTEEERRSIKISYCPLHNHKTCSLLSSHCWKCLNTSNDLLHSLFGLCKDNPCNCEDYSQEKEG